MTTTDRVSTGATAFANGEVRIVPRSILVNEGVEAARAWYRGWDAANLAAPVPDHIEPCGCQYVSVDLPDDQWIGQGWRNVHQCAEHAAVGIRPCVAESLRPRRRAQ